MPTTDGPNRTIRIGGASGSWGDSPRAVGQLIAAGVDYVMMDYLAEITMSLLARARMKDEAGGYPPDAVQYLVPHLDDLMRRGIRVVSNGGGVNPLGAKAALEAEIARADLDLTVAAVTGDDVLASLPTTIHEQAGRGDARLLTANAYLGAIPIAAALDSGADIVLTGRCADSALALGILMHEFGWTTDDFDHLAAGSLIGHLLECGPQATGGNFTDWQDVPDWSDIGYPIAECDADGSFVLTKAEGSGGLIDTRCVAEQLFYEIGDPRAYVLPDVIADFSEVELQQIDQEHVAVRGAKGRPPTPQYKVSATRQVGFRSTALVTLAGPAATAKARRTGEALLERAARICAEMSAAPLGATRVEVLGAEHGHRPQSSTGGRDVVLRVVMTHPDRRVLDHIAREAGSLGLACAPGITGLLGGRPKTTPQIVLETYFIEKRAVPVPQVVTGTSAPIVVAIPPGQAVDPPTPAPDENRTPTGGRDSAPEDIVVPLGAIAHARSGDKGDSSNIAVIARRPEFYQLILEQVTPERVREHFAHLSFGEIVRFEAPKLHAVNFLIQEALGGGGIASLRSDPQGKAYGQMLLERRITVPGPLAGMVDSHHVELFQ